MHIIRLYSSKPNLIKQESNYLSSLKTPLSTDPRSTLECEKVKSKYLFPSLTGLLGFLILSCISYLYILDINSLSVKLFANIFSHPVGCLFILFIVSFAVQKLFRLMQSHLFIFAFVAIAFGWKRWKWPSLLFIFIFIKTEILVNLVAIQ